MYYIYKIENLINHKVYIGLTNNIARRRIRHFTDLKCNRHDNHFLQKEYNIYGKENFSFNIEFEGDVTSNEISILEQEYIKKYDSYRNGYNQNEGGNFEPSNGGSKLTQSDIFIILAVLEFSSRSGQTLADMFNVSKTTISRIGHGVNHNQYKEEYEQLSLEERKNIYNIFCETTNFLNNKIENNKNEGRRRLNEQQVHLILLNKELNKPLNWKNFAHKFLNDKDGVIYWILNEKTYLDFINSYKELTQDQKLQLAALLRN